MSEPKLHAGLDELLNRLQGESEPEGAEDTHLDVAKYERRVAKYECKLATLDPRSVDAGKATLKLRKARHKLAVAQEAHNRAITATPA